MSKSRACIVLEKFRICYHGTVDIKGLMIRNNGIDLSVPFPGSDFGQGFYLILQITEAK